jgi:hypothetical protein
MIDQLSAAEVAADRLLDESMLEASKVEDRLVDARNSMWRAQGEASTSRAFGGGFRDAYEWDAEAAESQKDVADLEELRTWTAPGLAALQNEADRLSRAATIAELSCDPKVADRADKLAHQAHAAAERVAVATACTDLLPVTGGQMMTAPMVERWGDIGMVAVPVGEADDPSAYRVSFITDDGNEVGRLTLEPWACTTGVIRVLDKLTIAAEVKAMAGEVGPAAAAARSLMDQLTVRTGT